MCLSHQCVYLFFSLPLYLKINENIFKEKKMVMGKVLIKTPPDAHLRCQIQEDPYY